MKKILLFALAVASFAACTEPLPEKVDEFLVSEDFHASLQAESRTELDGTSVLWCEDDQLTIFTKTAHNRQYKLKSLTDDRRTATFGYVGYTGNNSSAIQANYALYPYNADATINGDVISTKLDFYQAHSTDKIDISAGLMVAKSQDNNLAFTNACALLRINISKSELVPESYTLNWIGLTSAAHKLSGDVTIDLAADCKAIVAPDGDNEVRLININREITTEVQSFYITVPAASYEQGDITVYLFGIGEFSLPALELKAGYITSISYTIKDTSEDFTGSFPSGR